MFSITYCGTLLSAPSLEDIKELIALLPSVPASVPLMPASTKATRAPLERPTEASRPPSEPAQGIIYVPLVEGEFDASQDYVKQWIDSDLNVGMKVIFRSSVQECAKFAAYEKEHGRQLAAYERLKAGKPSVAQGAGVVGTEERGATVEDHEAIGDFVPED